MPRGTVNQRPQKKLIYIFCEGESEQCYAKFLKQTFSDIASIKIPKSPGLFTEAKRKFKKDPSFVDNIEVIDEIWFFFDVEEDQRDNWDQYFKIIESLRKLRKKPYRITVRLLMTKACIEYWFMLHFKCFAPPLVSPAEKENMKHQLQQIIPDYEKGSEKPTFKIAKEYPSAIQNSAKVLSQLSADGLPPTSDMDARSRWLFKSGKTFSTVHEAIEFLQSLRHS